MDPGTGQQRDEVLTGGERRIGRADGRPAGSTASGVGVRRTASGPSQVSAAAAVTSLVVDAGGTAAFAPNAYKVRPVRTSITAPTTAGRSAGTRAKPSSAACRPAAVGT